MAVARPDPEGGRVAPSPREGTMAGGLQHASPHGPEHGEETVSVCA